MKPIAVLPLLAAAAIALGACGQSAEEKATSKVCDARDDISKQVDTLKGLTVSTATTSQIRDSISAIGDDLKQIADAQGDLAGQRKSQVEQANKQFTSQVQAIVSTLGTTTSFEQAKAGLTEALTNLATAYEQSFAKVDCGS